MYPTYLPAARGSSKKSQPPVRSEEDSDTESLGDFGLDSSESGTEEREAEGRGAEGGDTQQGGGRKGSKHSKKQQPAKKSEQQQPLQQEGSTGAGKKRKRAATASGKPANGGGDDDPSSPPEAEAPAPVSKRSRHPVPPYGDTQFASLPRFSARHVSRCIPGLASRLEFLRHVGLLSEEGVYKVPRAKEGSRWVVLKIRPQCVCFPLPATEPSCGVACADI
jgi:hypothetical protein